MLTVTLLGDFVVTLDGRRVILERRIGRLLAYLLLNSHKHNRELLADAMWPDDDKPHLGDLRGTILRLRAALGESDKRQVRVLGSEDHRFLWFQLQPDDQIDVLALEYARLTDADPNTLVKLAHSYKAPAADVADWFSVTRLERLAERHSQVLATLCTRLQERGEARQALDWSKRWIAHDLQSEDAYIRQMHLFAALGEEDGVLSTFELCERNKQMPASRKVREAHDRCIAQAQRVLEQGLLPQHNLPHYDTPLVGRATELAHVADTLSGPGQPMLSLIGLGGMGKTRLAVEAAWRALRHFPDGVYFVRLDAVGESAGDANSLAAQIAGELGFHFYAGESAAQQLRDRLSDKRLLLILDGFEHLLSPSGDEDPTGEAEPDTGPVIWLDQLLDAAEGVKVVVTSRQRLLSPHEHALDLQGLAVPEDADAPGAGTAEALDLFQRLARRRYSDELPAGDMVRICKLVQGMPLGIELAASWVRVKSCAEIADGIERERDLAAAQDAAQDAAGDVHHASLRATFDYSWKQLSAAERDLFVKLCLFEGGCTGAAAEAVAGATGSGLMSLADKSFIRREPNGRYMIHDLLREFGREKFEAVALAEQRADAERRLLNYFEQYAAAHRDDYDAFEHEWANVLGAVRLAGLRENWSAVLGVVEPVTLAWEERSRYADALIGHALATQAATVLRQRPMLLRSLRWQGRMLLQQARYAEAETFYAQALTLAMDEEDEKEIAWVKYDQAWAALEQGHIAEADRQVAESIALFEEYGHEADTPQALNLLARCRLQQSDPEGAIRAAERARDILEPRGPSPYLAHAYKWLSEAAQDRKDWETARRYCELALKISMSTGDNFTIASCYYVLGLLHYRSGYQYEVGLDFAQHAYQNFTKQGIKKSRAHAIGLIGVLNRRLGKLINAKEYLSLSLTEILQAGDSYSAVNYETYLGDVFQDLGDLDTACLHWRGAHNRAREQHHPFLSALEQRLVLCHLSAPS